MTVSEVRQFVLAACLQCGPQAPRGLARQQGQAAAGDEILRQDNYRPAGGDVDLRRSRQPGGEAPTTGALPGDRWPARLDRTGADPSATGEAARAGFSGQCKGRAAVHRPA